MKPSLKDLSLLKNQAYASGYWCDARSGRVLEVRDPADGQILGSVPSLCAEEVKEAILAAQSAMALWKKELASIRSKILRRWFDLITEHTNDLAAILTAEQGKPLAEARGEIAYAGSFVEWFASEANRLDGEIIPAPSADRRILVLKEPVGVCAAITPWNFPSAMVTRKVAPALAAGCAILVKPASRTPLSALALAALALRAGLPAGLFSVLTGEASIIGSAFTASPAVRKLSFTGSTEIGKSLIRDCAGTVKRVTMELGGNAPFIVFDDADLEAAVEGVIISKFRGSGQTCICANRILVDARVEERFTELLATAIRKLTVGPGTKEGVMQGPLIDRSAVEHIKRLIDDAVTKGGRVLVGGKPHALGGTFFEPTLLTGCTLAMQIANSEIFGPIAPIFSFENEAEAITLANATEYGLAAYFYSRDLARVWRVAEALECGMVGVNTGIISNAAAPFGGIKESGYGREGSRHGINDYLALKYLCIAGLGS
ncbi:MAG: NAD-dependent succinate-semialdehyde dehydrogenase [Verrucomicrobia bacterium]|nr:NAD-dependent succinate-semialdehyde dehydrogenase [Verrucomicrobiota bacterium]